MTTPPTEQAEPFVVRHYANDERPCIKGNGFDGLELGESREEAEAFVSWINARLATQPAAPAESISNELRKARAEAEQWAWEANNRDDLLCGWIAACAFIDSHVADPDITGNMVKHFAEFSKWREVLGRPAPSWPKPLQVVADEIGAEIEVIAKKYSLDDEPVTAVSSQAILDSSGRAASESGTPAARFESLMTELENRFIDPDPFSAKLPERRYLAMIDKLIQRAASEVLVKETRP
jgi:hypothetical protein